MGKWPLLSVKPLYKLLIFQEQFNQVYDPFNVALFS